MPTDPLEESRGENPIGKVRDPRRILPSIAPPIILMAPRRGLGPLRSRHHRESLERATSPSTPRGCDLPRALYRRRQFVIGPRAAPVPEHWRRTRLPDGLVISSHPDLPVTSAREGTITVTALGYLLDPLQPSLDDAALVHRLASEIHRATSAPEATHGLGGRYVLVVSDGRNTAVLGDACGLREIYYTHEHGERWLASQPELIADELSLRPSVGPHSRPPRDPTLPRWSWSEPFWPGDTTAYEGIRALLPNHLLMLDEPGARRFWPGRTIEPIALGDAAERGALLLAGIVAAGALRAPLAMPLTAGWDSRTLLAVSRPIAPMLWTFTFARPGMPRRHPDLAIARRVARVAGLTRHLVPVRHTNDAAFEHAYAESVCSFSDEAVLIAEAIGDVLPVDQVFLSSHGSEILRGGMHVDTGRPPAVDGPGLAWMYGMRDDLLACRAFDRWLAGAAGPARAASIDPLDLSYWEHRVGRWAANGQSQWDIITERLSPWSCRALLEMLLGTSVDERASSALHRAIIERSWPELLSVPFNPPYRTPLPRRAYARLRRAFVHPLAER